MSAKTIKPAEQRRRERRLWYGPFGFVWRTFPNHIHDWHHYRKTNTLRRRHLAEVNNPALIPAPRHKPHKRRERRGQGKPR